MLKALGTLIVSLVFVVTALATHHLGVMADHSGAPNEVAQSAHADVAEEAMYTAGCCHHDNAQVLSECNKLCSALPQQLGTLVFLSKVSHSDPQLQTLHSVCSIGLLRPPISA
ncbi:hypothetical protein [Polycladidibacter hongkongensis]|uniref:hypothetical protein n=1 Tax=Polycladidibacter hongkongensis TaxID=1647556 RepID=UPI00082E61E0|nr:hypothetical protein [Pseudovibrio hongkongensis]